MSGMGMGMGMGMGGGSGGSPYIKDLADRLNFLRTEILGRFDTGVMRDEWYVGFCQFHPELAS